MSGFWRLSLKWFCIALLSVAMCEVSLVVWDFWPAYQLTGKGVGGGKGVQYFTLDRELLFRMLPNQLHGINRDGFRDELPRKTGAGLIVVSGDSFPMGLAVEPHQTFPNVLERAQQSVEVYNLGVQGYGPDQELAAFKRYGLPLGPKRLILSLYPSNDFGDLLHNQLVEVGPSGQSLIENHPNPIEAVLPRLRLPMFWNLLRHRRFLGREDEERLNDILFEDLPSRELERAQERDKATRLMRLVLREFAQVARENRIELTAIVIPSYDAVEGADRDKPRAGLDELAVSLCREVGVDVEDFYPLFREWRGAPLYLPEDKHLSVEGHRFVAQRLAARLQPR